MKKEETIKKISCPNCNSENLKHHTKRSFCKECGAFFRPNKPYHGRNKRHPIKIKLQCALLYAQGYSVTELRKILNIEYIHKEVINRWLRKSCLTARPKPRLKDLVCPACNKKGYSVKDGYRLTTYGLKKDQRFLCRFCGSRFTLKGLIGVKKFPKPMRDDAVNYYFSDIVSLTDTSEYIKKKWGKRPDETTIWEWIYKKGLKTRGHFGNQYTRIEKTKLISVSPKAAQEKE